MATVIRCPHCQKLLDAGAGGKVECPYCHGEFVAPERGDQMAPPPLSPPQPVQVIAAEVVAEPYRPSSTPLPKAGVPLSTRIVLITVFSTLFVFGLLYVGGRLWGAYQQGVEAEQRHKIFEEMHQRRVAAEEAAERARE